MATRTFTALFTDPAAAETAMERLRAIGIPERSLEMHQAAEGDVAPGNAPSAGSSPSATCSARAATAQAARRRAVPSSSLALNVPDGRSASRGATRHPGGERHRGRPRIGTAADRRSSSCLTRGRGDPADACAARRRRRAMGFRAIVVDRDAEGRTQAGGPRDRARRPARGRGDGRGRLFDAQLQGRALPRAGRRAGARYPHVPGDRLRRPGRGLVRPALPARRPGGADRLAGRRGALGRLCAEGAGQGRLAGAAARGPDAAPGDGDRHRRADRDAGGDGARGARAGARRAGRCW